MKRLKDKYSAAYDMLNTSGFGWDDTHKCVTFDCPEILEAYLKSLLQPSLLCTAGPFFFVALRNHPNGVLNTPLTVVAAGLSKWLDIHSGVLTVRVLLSWFLNIPWDRQPISAIQDLCDPYLNLLWNINPLIFNTFDVSPLLAFTVLGTLGSILNGSREEHNETTKRVRVCP
ncbi:hypothetical protein Ddye_000448, partial [Dipteronia dyeriana]